MRCQARLGSLSVKTLAQIRRQGLIEKGPHLIAEGEIAVGQRKVHRGRSPVQGRS
jgi:hypothetical protein